MVTEPEDTTTRRGTRAATHARATATRPALSTSWGDPPEGEADAAKMHEPAPWRSAASSAGVALLTSPGLDVTREASAEETPASAAEKAPARVHATTGRPVLAAYATHRLPVLPLAPNTTTGAADGVGDEAEGAGSGTAPGASSADAAGTNARREGAGARRARRGEA